jgi:hypothetical protein
MMWSVDGGKDYVPKRDSEIADQNYPQSDKLKMMLYILTAYTLLLVFDQLCIFVNTTLNRVKFDFLSVDFISSVIMAATNVSFNIMINWKLVKGRLEVTVFGLLATVWYFLFATRILVSLTSTKLFGPTIRNIQLMIVKTASYVMFLTFSVFTFSVYLLIT